MQAATTAMHIPACSQYARSAGHLSLVEQISHYYGPRLAGRPLDPLAEVVVTVGASEAIFLIMQAYVQPGDEVVVVEPFFDIYKGAVELSGGTLKHIPLRPKVRAWCLKTVSARKNHACCGIGCSFPGAVVGRRRPSGRRRTWCLTWTSVVPC